MARLFRYAAGDLLAMAALLAATAPAAAQRVGGSMPEQAAAVLARPVPVTRGDIGDRYYRVIGRIDTFVGKPLWQKPPGEAKIFRELWERAERMGADAVVNAVYSQPECELSRSCGGRQASGDAIRFLTAEEVTAMEAAKAGAAQATVRPD